MVRRASDAEKVCCPCQQGPVTSRTTAAERRLSGNDERRPAQMVVDGNDLFRKSRTLDAQVMHERDEI